MNAVEIAVYFIAAVILGALVIGFFADWNYKGIYEHISESLLGKESPRYVDIERNEFVRVALQFYTECKATDRNTSIAIHLLGEQNYTKRDFFLTVKNLSLCGTLQSAEQNCSSGETFMSFPLLSPPILFEMKCSNATLWIQP